MEMTIAEGEFAKVFSDMALRFGPELAYAAIKAFVAEHEAYRAGY